MFLLTVICLNKVSSPREAYSKYELINYCINQGQDQLLPCNDGLHTSTAARIGHLRTLREFVCFFENHICIELVRIENYGIVGRF